MKIEFISVIGLITGNLLFTIYLLRWGKSKGENGKTSVNEIPHLIKPVDNWNSAFINSNPSL